MNEQSPDKGRRGFLQFLGFGAIAAVGAKTLIPDVNPQDIEKESTIDSVTKLLEEMKYIERVPVIETTANENALSEAGWLRLHKVVAEKFSSLKNNPDATISKKDLEALLVK